MNKRLAATAILVAACVTAAGLFASPSNSASRVCPTPPARLGPGCLVTLTVTGPSPSSVKVHPGEFLVFRNSDSVTHTVVFANGRCTLTVPPGGEYWPGDYGPHGNGCRLSPLFYVGSYAFTVDGKFAGTVVTTPLPRSVSLTARTHTIRGGTRLTLHGQVTLNHLNGSPPAPVVVLARHNGKQSFEPIATVRTRYKGNVLNHPHATYGWTLNVQPEVTTTYIAKVRAQRLCYFPASRCAHPQGQVWANAQSRALTVRTRP